MSINNNKYNIYDYTYLNNKNHDSATTTKTNQIRHRRRRRRIRIKIPHLIVAILLFIFYFFLFDGGGIHIGIDHDYHRNHPKMRISSSSSMFLFCESSTISEEESSSFSIKNSHHPHIHHHINIHNNPLHHKVIGRASLQHSNVSTIVISSPPGKSINGGGGDGGGNGNNKTFERMLAVITPTANGHHRLTLFNANGCPPMEFVRPCKCLEHHNELYFRTLLLCNGSDFKYERRFENILLRLSKRLGNRHSKYFDYLHLVNMDNVRKITRNFFAGIRFKHLIIEDAPNLKHLHPASFKMVTNLLRYFYAYNTGLEAYRQSPMKPPLSLMRNLTEVHIASRKNICPPKEIIFPCECNVRKDQLMPFKINRQILQIRCTNQRGIMYNVTNIFHRLNKLLMMNNNNVATTVGTATISIGGGNNAQDSSVRKTRPQWYFDEVILRNVTELPENAFGEVDFSELHIEHATRLNYIDRNAFSSNSTLQKLRISGANFTNDRLSETFEAINGLKYLRSLFMWSCIIEFIPELAFANTQFYLKEIVLYGNNIKAIGSFAFANLPNLEELRIDGNNIILVDKYAFATNYTSIYPLRLTLVANNLDETSFAFMAMNGAQRPVHLSFAEIGGCYWNMKYLDEQIFAPFLDKSTNRVYLEPECELRCEDCRMKWLTEIPKHAQKRITLLLESNYRSMYNLSNEGYVPCENGANLYDIYELQDWDRCN